MGQNVGAEAGANIPDDNPSEIRRRSVENLETLVNIIRMCRESEICAPDDWEGYYPSGAPAPPNIPVKYHLETLPLRFARRMQRRRKRSAATLYMSVVRDISGAKVGTAEVFHSYNAVCQNPETEVLDLDLRAGSGLSLEEVVHRAGGLLESWQDLAVPSASDLPYTFSELGYRFPQIATLSERWLFSQKHHSINTVDRILTIRGFYEDETDAGYLAARIAEFYEMFATTRMEDGSEFGLADPHGPKQGWLAWYREMLSWFETRLAEVRESAHSSGQLVLPPTEAVPQEPPGLADPKYHYAAQIYAAYEGAPITDTAEIASDAITRISRSFLSAGLRHGPVDQAIYDQMKELLTRASEDDTLLDRTLGPTVTAKGRNVQEALICAINWIAPADFAFGWPHEPEGRSRRLEDLPMNRWEVRFRFPEVRDLCSHLGLATTPDGLNTAANAFITSKEPCRVWLPPIIGEIKELLALLPSDEDLDNAMNHLGATGTGWRHPLDRLATGLTDHIWHHEDHPGEVAPGPAGTER